MLAWFNTKASARFGRDLAKELLETLTTTAGKRDHKFAAKMERTLVKADAKVAAFRATERMNFYKRSKLANEFLWTLRDGGCPPDYAKELTEWLTFRL